MPWCPAVFGQRGPRLHVGQPHPLCLGQDLAGELGTGPVTSTSHMEGVAIAAARCSSTAGSQSCCRIGTDPGPVREGVGVGVGVGAGSGAGVRV